MKIEITRSFTLTRQVEQFQPRVWNCTVKMEVEEKDAALWSERMNDFCRMEVEKSEQLYTNPLSKVVKFDESAPANIKEDPWWKKTDLAKVNFVKVGDKPKVDGKHKDVGMDCAEQEVVEDLLAEEKMGIS